MSEAEYKQPRNHAAADELAESLDVVWDGEPTLREKQDILRSVAESRGLVEPEQVEAPYGYDVLGEDGRRVFRSLPFRDAKIEADRVSGVTGETLRIVPSEIAAPSVAAVSFEEPTGE